MRGRFIRPEVTDYSNRGVLQALKQRVRRNPISKTSQHPEPTHFLIYSMLVSPPCHGELLLYLHIYSCCSHVLQTADKLNFFCSHNCDRNKSTDQNGRPLNGSGSQGERRMKAVTVESSVENTKTILFPPRRTRTFQERLSNKLTQEMQYGAV